MVRVHLGLPLSSGDAPVEKPPGDVAQLVEHLVCNQGVVGSSPIVSTMRAVAATREKEKRIARLSGVPKLFDKLGW